MRPEQLEHTLQQEHKHRQKTEILTNMTEEMRSKEARHRMPQSIQVVPPARGLYTLVQYPAYDNPAATTSPVTIVPTVPAAPDPANDQGANLQAAPVTIVPTVSITSTAHIIRQTR